MNQETSISSSERLWQSMLELSRHFLWAEDPKEIVDALALHLKSNLGFPQVAIYNLKTEREPAVALLWEARGPHPIWPSVPIQGDAILTEVLSGTEPIVVADARTDPRTNKEVVEAKGARTLVFLPMEQADGSRMFVSTGTFGEESWEPTPDSLDYLARLGYFTSLALDRLALSEDQVILSEEAERAERLELLGRMAGSGAHDLRNQLTVISGYTSLLADLVPADSEVAQQVQKIEKAAASAIGVVREVLSFSRRHKPKGEPLDIEPIIRPLRGVLEGLLGDGSRLHLNVSPDLGAVNIRRDDLEQMLVHLVANAGEALVDPGEVSVSITRSGPRFAHDSRSEWVCLTVADTGPGLPPKIAERVFDPFFSTRSCSKHSGLGLFTCYGIANQAGGHISIDSKLGTGTTFKVMLPVVEPITPSKSKKSTGEPKTKPLKSSGALVNLCRDLLKAKGFDEILEAGRSQISEQLGLHHLLIYIAREDPPQKVELWSCLGGLDLVLVPQSFDVTQNKLAQAAISSEKTIVVPDARTSPLTDKKITERLGSRTLISVPFRLADGRRGALGTGSFGAQGVYDAGPEQIEFLEALASLLVVAFDRSRILEEQRGLRRKILRGRHMEAVSRLGQGLADDIRNALTGIDGFTHLTQESLPADHEAQKPLAKISEISQQAARILDKLVAFTCPDSPPSSSFDLNVLLHSLRPPLQRVVQDCPLEIRASAEPCWVNADWNQLEQVVLNLVFNAKEASESGSVITLSTERTSETVRFTVRDHGRGMSTEVKSMALEPFFTTKGPTVGTGLGLSTCRRIVNEAGGTISLSSSPDQGTEVALSLPAGQAGKLDR